MDIYEEQEHKEQRELLVNDDPYGNLTDNSSTVECSRFIPTAGELFRDQPQAAATATAIAAICMLVVVLIYIEEFAFLVHYFRMKRRRMSKTIWVLAVYPVFAVTSMLGVAVPRAGTLVDLVANVYFASCMYEFVRLMVDYMGGDRMMWAALEDKKLCLRVPPCCCCCVCLPDVKFTRQVYVRLLIMVLQLAVVRPILFFIAAVLWTNGNYTPGVIATDNAYIYISVLNLLSTLWAMYGLLLLENIFSDSLKEFSTKGKFMSLQLLMVITILLNIIINIIVANGVIPCNEVLSSVARGDRITHGLITAFMVPMSLLGRKFYRRKEEADMVADSEKKVPLREQSGRASMKHKDAPIA